MACYFALLLIWTVVRSQVVEYTDSSLGFDIIFVNNDNTSISQPDAKLYCQNNHGGNLVSVKSQNVTDIIIQLYNQANGLYNYWIGLERTDKSCEGSEKNNRSSVYWKWSSGETFFENYSNWENLEPNNCNSKCLRIKLSANHKWGDWGCTPTQFVPYFVCQTYVTPSPTKNPTQSSLDPTNYPSEQPSISPTNVPSINPTYNPSNIPTTQPSGNPSIYPTVDPSMTPSNTPTFNPSNNPSTYPTTNPSMTPSKEPSNNPTHHPTNDPSANPSYSPAFSTNEPTVSPSTKSPSQIPSQYPTLNPTANSGSNNNQSNSKSSVTGETWFILLIAIIGATFITLPLMYFLYHQKQNSRDFRSLSRSQSPITSKQVIEVSEIESPRNNPVFMPTTDLHTETTTATAITPRGNKKLSIDTKTTPGDNDNTTDNTNENSVSDKSDVKTPKGDLDIPKKMLEIVTKREENDELYNNEIDEQDIINEINDDITTTKVEPGNEIAVENNMEDINLDINIEKITSGEGINDEISDESSQENQTTIEGEKIDLGNVKQWTTQDVLVWLNNTVKLPQYNEIFENNNITGESLLSLNDDILFKIGIVSYGHRFDILKFIQKL